MAYKQDQLDAAALLSSKLDDLMGTSSPTNGKSSLGGYAAPVTPDATGRPVRKGGVDQAARRRGGLTSSQQQQQQQAAAARDDDDSDLDDSESDLSEESDEAAAIERIEQERIDNIRKWKYRKEAYKQFSAAFYDMCWKPFVICASGAFGLSFGYALYDYVVDKFFFWRKK